MFAVAELVVEIIMSQIELSPGLADVPVAESAISFVDGKRARLSYRGIAGGNPGPRKLL